MTLNSLIKACKKNKRSAQRELYHRYKDTLYLLCLKYCKNTEDAEDNLQDAFLSILTNISNYKGKGSFEGWMKRITINKAIDKYKKDAFINVIINDNILTDTKVEIDELSLPLSIILKTVQELPDRYRLVFNLYELDGFSHKDIAEILGISIGTSKSNLHRAKHILKEKIEVINLTQTNNKLIHGK